jgi:hypothetical protein
MGDKCDGDSYKRDDAALAASNIGGAQPAIHIAVH